MFNETQNRSYIPKETDSKQNYWKDSAKAYLLIKNSESLI